ncbi:MAG: exodeoxyribonuclease VII large subunit [Bacteroidota bacterium]
MEKPDQPGERKVFTLLQLSTSIKSAFDSITQNRSFWIKGEISGLNFANSGHIYFNLVQLEGDRQVAVAKACIWQSVAQRIRVSLGDEFYNVLKNGSEIVCLVKVNFDHVHSLSIHLTEIDISFNLGALEKKKLETIQQLKDEGLFERNKWQTEPRVIRRIALLASPNTSAYEDFKMHQANNEHGYTFFTGLFPVVVQGESAAASILAALLTVDTDEFDAVAIIRGGGSKLDLDPFNDLQLSRQVALMDLPVMTGIGHETDVSVLDMIAKSPHKTPTALADYIVDKAYQFERSLSEIFLSIARISTETINSNRLQMASFYEILQTSPGSSCQRLRGDLAAVASTFSRKSSEILNAERSAITDATTRITLFVEQRLTEREPQKLAEMSNSIWALATNKLRLQVSQMENIIQSIEMVRPEKSMERGFSITRSDGKVVKDSADLKVGDVIETALHSGSITSQVLKLGK